MATTVEIKPVALFHCDKTSPTEAARQGSVDTAGLLGEIRFSPGSQFDLALDDIDGFSHLWLLYHFHQNSEWKSKVQPPRGSDKKIGVFATRSPYRPNAIGLSCVELVRRENLSLWVRNFDLLDQTPILDLKPYLAYADSFPDAQCGWLDGIEVDQFVVDFSDLALKQIHFLKTLGLQQLENVIRSQLAYDPLNSQKKRVKVISESTGIFAFKTWRARFSIEDRKIQVNQIFSGYTESELQDPLDPYQDKELHHEFNKNFIP